MLKRYYGDSSYNENDHDDNGDDDNDDGNNDDNNSHSNYGKITLLEECFLSLYSSVPIIRPRIF